MKTIPALLQTDLNQDATTWCFITRVQTKSGLVLGFADLDTSLTYDDGSGAVEYKADSGGFAPARIQASADLGVDNTEMMGWVSDTGITEAQIRAGLFDYAKVRIYRVNYLDLSHGHEIMATGTLGQTEFTENSFKVEFRSLTQQLKQPISSLYSLTCTVAFGSARCGKPLVWVPETITAVDPAQSARIFTASGLLQADGYFVPGVLKCITGANAGEEMDVEAFAAGVVTLFLPLAYPLAIGDTFEIRQDCNKVARTVGTKQGDCKDKHNNLLNFRGQSYIPVANSGASLIPGSEIA